MAASNPEDSQELDFPPVRVDHSIEELDLNSLIMRSNTRPHPQEPTSLDESTYEVVALSDSVYETSDDEGHTASVASTTPDDISTFDDEGEEEDDDFARYSDDPPQPMETSTIETADHDVPSTVHDSALTEEPYMGQSESLSEIRMAPEGEPDHELDVDFTKVWAVTKEFTAAQTAEGVLKPYECGEMRLTVRACVSVNHMPARSSFKILYVGNISDWARVDVVSCISKALDASPGPSRSIMRHGQMEPYGPILSSDHCTDLKLLDNAEQSPSVLVTFDDGMTIPFGTSEKYSATQTSRLPDLAVFWYPHPRLAAPEVENFPAACEALGKHQIPCLHVAEDRRFHQHSLKPVGDSSSLQLCVEGKNGDSEAFLLKEYIPIDLYTLQNLDSSQLNQHLCALKSRTASSQGTSRSKPWNLGTYSTYVSKVIQSVHGSPFKFTLALGLLTLMLSCYYLALPSMSLMRPGTPSVHDQVPLDLCRSPDPLTQTAPQSLSTAASSSSSQPALSTQGGLSVILPLQRLPSRRLGKKKAEKSIFYDIHRTGEHQFTLSPDKDCANRKSKPQLQIQVMKNAKKVPIRYTRTTDGGYVVNLEHEYGVGLFNVTIATHSKPLKMQQWFTVSMGQNKTMIAQFVDLVNRDVAATQESLTKMSSALTQRAQVVVARAGTNINGWKKQAHLPKTDLGGGIQETRKVVQRQFASGVTMLQEASAETWMGLRKVTAPVRTSSAALRARNNAFQIRCRFEEAVGLSDTKQHGKKTRACKHASQ